MLYNNIKITINYIRFVPDQRTTYFRIIELIKALPNCNSGLLHFEVFAVNDVGKGPTGVKTFTLRKGLYANHYFKIYIFSIFTNVIY